MRQEPPVESGTIHIHRLGGRLRFKGALPAHWHIEQEPRAHQRASVCSACGTVASVTPVRTQGASTGIGAIGGALAGGLLGNQFGAGNGRAAMTVVGAVGGGLAGNEVEKNMRSETYYRVSVHMDNGTWRSFNYRSAPGVQPGTRVRLENGRLVMAG